MTKLQTKINEYLKNNSIRSLMKETKVSCWIIYLLKDWVNRKYSKRILDNIYSLLKIEKDEFYKKNVFIPQSHNDLWLFFKIRRERLWLSTNQVAKLIKWEERQVRNFENWFVDYKPNSYYFTKLVELYDINWEEKEKILRYSNSLKELLDLQKKEKFLFLNNKENNLN